MTVVVVWQAAQPAPAQCQESSSVKTTQLGRSSGQGSLVHGQFVGLVPPLNVAEYQRFHMPGTVQKRHGVQPR